ACLSSAIPRRPGPLPLELPARAFTVARAAELGVSAARLRSADIESIGWGVYRLAGQPTTELDVAGALIGDTPDLLMSHLTAARVRRWPLPHGKRWEDWRPSMPLELTASSPAGRIRRRDLVLRRQEVPPAERSSIRDVPVTSIERTWVDLAAVLSLVELVVIGDHLVRRPRPGLEDLSRAYSHPDLLAAAVGRAAGRPGVRRAREALDRVRIGSDSPKET